jgi:hypothetical protein
MTMMKLHANETDYDGPRLRQSPRASTPLLPGLLDVTLVIIGDDALVLTGFERLELADGHPADYAQSWWVQLRS